VHSAAVPDARFPIVLKKCRGAQDLNILRLNVEIGGLDVTC
jgi:hypothetical protein